MPRVILPNDFIPRPYQERPMDYLDNGGKRLIWVVHRRGGKDLTMGHQVCKMAHEEIGAYWHIFPSFAQGRRMLWEGFRRDGKRTMENIFPGFLDRKRRGSVVEKVDQGEMKVELKCGSIYRVIGSDRTENVGAGPKGIVGSEFALCKPTAWDYLRPMLRESGGWFAAITTPRGKNHAWKMFQAAGPGSGWFRDILTVHDTKLTYASNKSDRQISPDEMMAEERAEGMEEALIRQEYLCDWMAAQVGSIYGDLLELLEKRGGMEFFPQEGDCCFVNFDLGVTDDTDMFLWRLNHRSQYGVDVLKHYSAHGKPLEHYFQVLDGWHKAGFRLERLWLPHDARAKTLVTGGSVLEMTAEACRGERWGKCSVAIVPQLSLVDGLQAGRWLLQQDGMRFHPEVAGAVEALRTYHYEYDEDAKTFSTKPEHDWSSHTADDFRYLAVVVRHTELVKRVKPAPTPLTVVHPQTPTMNDLWKQHEEDRNRERWRGR